MDFLLPPAGGKVLFRGQEIAPPTCLKCGRMVDHFFVETELYSGDKRIQAVCHGQYEEVYLTQAEATKMVSFEWLTAFGGATP